MQKPRSDSLQPLPTEPSTNNGGVGQPGGVEVNERTPLVKDGGGGDAASGGDGNSGTTDVEELKVQTGSIASSFANLTNTILGAGVLGMPFAFSRAGYAGSIFLLPWCGFLGWLGLHLLACVADEMPVGKATFLNASRLSYPWARVLIDAAIAIKCFGVGIAYLTITGDLMPPTMLTIVGDDLRQYPLLLDRNTYIGFSALLLVPLCFFKHIDSLKYSSVVALFSMLYLVFLVIYYFANPAAAGRKLFENLTPFAPNISILPNLPIFVFAFTCHQNLFSIYNDLPRARGRRINTVITVSVSICATMYAIVGYLGYFTFGAGIDEDLLKDYPETVLVAIGRVGVVLNVLLSYPLQCHPARTSLDGILAGIFPRLGEITPLRLVLITQLVLVASYAVALSVSELGLIFSIVGATGSVTICYLLPGLLYYKVKAREGWTVRRIASVMLVLWGLTVMVSSLTATILASFGVLPRK